MVRCVEGLSDNLETFSRSPWFVNVRLIIEWGALHRVMGGHGCTSDATSETTFLRRLFFESVANVTGDHVVYLVNEGMLFVVGNA